MGVYIPHTGPWRACIGEGKRKEELHLDGRREGYASTYYPRPYAGRAMHGRIACPILLPAILRHPGAPMAPAALHELARLALAGKPQSPIGAIGVRGAGGIDPGWGGVRMYIAPTHKFLP